jgi:hypothetical protein
MTVVEAVFVLLALVVIRFGLPALFIAMIGRISELSRTV